MDNNFLTLKLESEINTLKGRIASYQKEQQFLINDARELRENLAKADSQYYDLIYQVGIKYPNETRHETAKRYIRDAENRPYPSTQESWPVGQSLGQTL